MLGGLPQGLPATATTTAASATVASATAICVTTGHDACGGILRRRYWFLFATGFYFLTADSAEIAALDAGAYDGAWQRTGQQFNVYPLAGAPNVSSTVWRFFGIFSTKGTHFYTAYLAEYNALVNGTGWVLEGPVFSVPLPANDGTCPFNTIPVYRMYNNGINGASDHRFSTDTNVPDQMLAQGWIREGVGIGVAFCSPL